MSENRLTKPIPGTSPSTSSRAAKDMTDLERRWNRAASSVGICGSEFHNDPEAVFARVREIMSKHRAARIEVAHLRREAKRPDGYRVVNWRHKLRVVVNPDGTQTLRQWKLPVWGWRRT